MTKIRILHIMTRYLGGGSETYVNHLINKMDPDKYEHVIAHGKIYNKDMINKLKVKTICFKNLSHYNPITNLLAIRDIYRYLARNKINIIHTHQTEAGIIGRMAANLYRHDYLDYDIKIIHTVHGIPFTKNRNIILRKILIDLERLCATYTNHIITISNDMKEIYLDNSIGTFDQFKYIPLGIDLDQFKKAKPLKEIKTEDNIIKFVIVSRITKGKGFEDLVKAVDSLVYISGKKLKIYVVGEGEFKQDLIKLIDQKGLSNCFIFMGYRSDVPSILKSCDVFVLPSYFEGTPWTIYEAMAAGLPIISTNISGIPEQVKHEYNGYLMVPGRISNLTLYMKCFCNNKELIKIMGSNSITKIKDFKIEKMIENIEKLYKKEGEL